MWQPRFTTRNRNFTSLTTLSDDAATNSTFLSFLGYDISVEFIVKYAAAVSSLLGE